MTDKQRFFVAEYLKDFNATQAAIRAGYSEKSARNRAYELLVNKDIKAAITEYVENLLSAEASGLKKRILGELSSIAFDPLPDDSSRSERDRLKALELLGKYMSLFTDKVEHSGAVKVAASVDISSLSDEAKEELRRAVHGDKLGS